MATGFQAVGLQLHRFLSVVICACVVIKLRTIHAYMHVSNGEKKDIGHLSHVQRFVFYYLMSVLCSDSEIIKQLFATERLCRLFHILFSNPTNIHAH